MATLTRSPNQDPQISDEEEFNFTNHTLQIMYDQRKRVDLDSPQQINGVQNPCLYLFHFLTNGKMYVGETTNFKNRMYAHKRDALTNKRGGCTALQAAINKHGWDMIDVYILAEDLHSKEQRGDLENEFIYFLKTKAGQNGYNIRDGGATGKMAEETKQRMSVSTSKWRAETVDPVYFFKYMGPNSSHVFVGEFKNLVEVRTLFGDSTYESAATSLNTSTAKGNGDFFWINDAWTYATRTKQPRTDVGKPNATPVIVRIKDSDRESIFKSQHAAAKAVGLKSSLSIMKACKEADLNKLEWRRSTQNHAIWYVAYSAYSPNARRFVEAFLVATQGKPPKLKAQHAKSVVLRFKNKEHEELVFKNQEAAARALGGSWYLVVSACQEAEKGVVRWRRSPNGLYVAHSAYSANARESVETFLQGHIKGAQ